MKTQYILITTLIIISILSYYYLEMQKIEISSREDIYSYAKNFEREIIYIAKNFNKSKILNFTLIYGNYLSKNNLKMDFVCIVSEKYYDNSILECINTDKNCCYVIKKPTYLENELKYCRKAFLFNNPDLVCICYNISTENDFYSNLLCT